MLQDAHGAVVPNTVTFSPEAVAVLPTEKGCRDLELLEVVCVHPQREPERVIRGHLADAVEHRRTHRDGQQSARQQ